MANMRRQATFPLLSFLFCLLLPLVLCPLPTLATSSSCASVSMGFSLCSTASCPANQQCTSCTVGFVGRQQAAFPDCYNPNTSSIPGGIIAVIVVCCLLGIAAKLVFLCCFGLGCFHDGRYHRYWIARRRAWWAMYFGSPQVGVVYQQRAVSPKSAVQMTQVKMGPGMQMVQMQPQMHMAYARPGPVYVQQQQQQPMQPQYYAQPGQPVQYYPLQQQQPPPYWGMPPPDYQQAQPVMYQPQPHMAYQQPQQQHFGHHGGGGDSGHAPAYEQQHHHQASPHYEPPAACSVPQWTPQEAPQQSCSQPEPPQQSYSQPEPPQQSSHTEHHSHE